MKGKAAVCPLHEILMDREGRSLRNQGGVWSKIIADPNSLADFFEREPGDSRSNSRTKRKGCQSSSACARDWEVLGAH